MFECKVCHKEYDITYKLQVDSDKDKDAVESIKNGSLVEPTCPYCGKKSPLDLPLIYKNTFKKFIIYYVPETMLDILDDVIDYEKLTNLPSAMHGRYTTSPIRFSESVKAVEEKGFDSIYESIANGSLSSHLGLFEIK